MSIEKNKELTLKIFDAIGSGDWDFLRSVYADDVNIWVAGDSPISGTYDKSFLDQLDEGNKQIFPNGIRLVVHAMTAEGDRLAAEVESFGEHVSGKSYNNHYHVLFVFKEGLVVDYKEYMDTAHVNDVMFGDA